MEPFVTTTGVESTIWLHGARFELAVLRRMLGASAGSPALLPCISSVTATPSHAAWKPERTTPDTATPEVLPR
jgi:hypothetical protein